MVQFQTEVKIPAQSVNLEGEIAIPTGAPGVVIFAHGSGSSRFSPRNNYVARILRKERLGTLLFDLLTEEEDMVYETRFDIELLTERLAAATRWFQGQPYADNLKIGYFGASTGAAAALKAASILGNDVSAIVSRGGRPDLASDILAKVKVPTLLMVGGNDPVVISLNRDAYVQLGGEKDLVVIPGASHLFEEPGKLEQVADLAVKWFRRCFESQSPQ